MPPLNKYCSKCGGFITYEFYYIRETPDMTYKRHYCVACGLTVSDTGFLDRNLQEFQRLNPPSYFLKFQEADRPLLKIHSHAVSMAYLVMIETFESMDSIIKIKNATFLQKPATLTENPMDFYFPGEYPRHNMVILDKLFDNPTVEKFGAAKIITAKPTIYKYGSAEDHNFYVIAPTENELPHVLIDKIIDLKITHLLPEWSMEIFDICSSHGFLHKMHTIGHFVGYEVYIPATQFNNIVRKELSLGHFPMHRYDTTT